MNITLTFFAQLLAIVLPVVALSAIVGLVIYLRRKGRPETRLAKLEQLRASGVLTAGEYERQRASIVSGV